MNTHFHAHTSFAPVFNYSQGNPMQQYTESQYPVHHGFPGLQYMYGYQQPRNHHLLAERNTLGDGKTESKPRLSKEEVEKLEKVFQENPKPSSSVKAQLADGLGLERPRINNWFQNRRAKAKQERKQEEYEARRAAEKASSEPIPLDEDLSSGASEHSGENVHQHMQPSSAPFPDLNGSSETTDGSGDNENPEEDSADSDGSGSPSLHNHSGSHQSDVPTDFQSPLSFDFSPAEVTNFAHLPIHSNYSHSGPVGNYSSFLPSQQQNVGIASSDDQSARLLSNLSSPSEQCLSMNAENAGRPFSGMMDADFSNSTAAPYLPTHTAMSTPVLSGSPMDTMTGHADSVATPMSEGQVSGLMAQGMTTPGDSFKSPPPPANIASRRNIPRPAALQTASLRSRSHNFGCGPKTALDGSKRVDPSSPAATMRRIVSTAGTIHGRIQKSSAGPRSPMFFNRNPEVLLHHYHSRSPIGPATATFPGAAPPTPMTPVVVEQQAMREPTVSSTCSDDSSFLLGGRLSASNLIQEFKAESNLKTPPSTPGLLTQFGNPNYPFGAGVEFHTDQPLLTPYFQPEFTDLSVRNVPSYAELNDGSLPTTPLYPTMIGSLQEHVTYGHNSIANTQFDWDANESVSSSKSSPNQPRSKQIQFTQNMTPQDYTSHLHHHHHQEK
ncbi:hypothetical protein GGS23DRAFT_409217 [Durotheca rogersii]|uniref:uncharacterized protein n=1 Tax=Durotheca rogersii TaxID=419775 RepID=UPI0022210C4C|nr:uncharacterized protein GGS23DRAFT_409217 [Durotheca rogersii]KAI5865103.1 hypothetical protein GGS23DRAFT_409217 [Durotheca rogersii]